MDGKSMKELLLSSAAYSLSSIAGPLLLLGVPAYFLDDYLNTKPLVTLIAVFVAFVITNVMLFKKVQKINRMMLEKFAPVDPDKKNNDSVTKED